ncbi:MAG: TetR/AcrR family transcriptional regulator [candidate division Zixibacteria bacterium]|nr:TetR/AcrR family transcriptional regulator [candidate division Zixibacteria bacterium]
MPLLDENLIAQLAKQKVVTETFRRLPPEKKNLIYQTAVRLFGRYGYDGLPIDRLCREAGISKGSFFQYFPSKTHLLEFVILVFDDFFGKWIADVKRQEKAVLARDRLLHLYHAVVLNAKLFPAEKIFYLFATHAVEHAGVEIEGIDIERHVHEHVQQIIERGEETGEIRRDVKPELTGYLVAIIFGALVTREYAGKRISSRPSGEYLISVLFDGIKA